MQNIEFITKSSLVLASLLVFEIANSSNLGESVSGVYKGEIGGGGGRIYPGVTEFTQDSDGKIIGKYRVEVPYDIVTGELYHCTEKLETRQVICRFNDKYGSGVVDLLFSKEFNSFSGLGTDDSFPDKILWNGKR
jgi:hypothetical protein